MYISTKTLELFTIEHIRQKHLLDSSYDIDNAVVKKLGYEKVQESDKPQYDPNTEYIIVSGVCVNTNGEWVEEYTVLPSTYKP